MSQRRRMLDEYNELPEMAKLDQRGDTVYTTWRMCYDQLKSDSRELLWLIAYLHYDGLTEKMFKRAAQHMHSKTYPLPPTDLETQAIGRLRQYLSIFIAPDGSWDSVKFVRVMADLTSYSLIDFDRMNLTYRGQVLVHDWAKTLVPHSPELTIECTATLLSLTIDWEQDAESLVFKRQLGLHVTSVLTRSPNMGGNHSHYFAEVYSCTGQLIQEAELEQRVVETFRQELGDDHIHTWSAIHRFSRTCSHLGQWDKALGLQMQVLDARRRLLGEEHPDTLVIVTGLATTYSDLGRYEDAKQLQIQVLDIYKRVLEEEHQATMITMGNLASTYTDLGLHNQAEQLNIRVLNVHKRVLGDEHPRTLTSMGNLASTYSNLGRHNEAELLRVQVFNTHQRVLGDKHLQTLYRVIDYGPISVSFSTPNKCNATHTDSYQINSRQSGKLEAKRNNSYIAGTCGYNIQ